MAQQYKEHLLLLKRTQVPFQAPTGGSQPSVTPAILFSPPIAPSMHVMHIYKHKQNIQTDKIKW